MRRLSLVLAAAAPWGTALAIDSVDLGEIVVTSPMMSDPLTVVTDPKAPRQPIPASDGASYLDNIPGFSVSRKGGTDGDPALRGLGGSRLNILLDDSAILGGCGQRMDPPTAYVYPESYDEVTVLKGPQSVRWGSTVAGTVRFERDTDRFEEPGVRGVASAVVGSYGRNDQLADVTLGNPTGFIRAIGTRSDADDYKDGDGDEVHSAYTRWSGTAIAGWTPDADTRLEFSYDVSDGEAAYADRTMDGTQFEREGYAVELERRNISPLVERVEFKAYRNYIDHVMDNYTLREPPLMMGSPMKMVSNPDRETVGARLEAQLGLGDETFALVGLDYQANEHRARRAVSRDGSDPDLGSRIDKADFSSRGVFGELTHSLTLTDRIVTGLRIDRAEAEADDPAGYGGAVPGDSDEDTNSSLFARYEHDLNPRSVAFVGIGRAVRSPDFWERDRDFGLDPERNTQVDAGVNWAGGALQANLSLFYARIADYILITDFGAAASNVDATTYGGEGELAYALSPRWTTRGALSYVYGNNDSDDVPLAQMPPLELSLGLDYKDEVYSAGVMWRAAARQTRVDEGSGTIFGTDIGETAGYGIVSVNAGYRPRKDVLLTAGIDNLLDRTYARHLGRGSADLGTVTGRVNEPGRTFWVKGSVEF